MTPSTPCGPGMSQSGRLAVPGHGDRDAGGDLGRMLPERLARAAEGGAVQPPEDRHPQRPPVHRHRMPGSQQPERLGRPPRGPGGPARGSAPSRRPGAARGRRRPGRPCRRSCRCRLRRRPSGRPVTRNPIGVTGGVPRRRLTGCTAGAPVTRSPRTSNDSPTTSSATRPEVTPATSSPAPRGTTTVEPLVSRRRDGRSRWSWCAWLTRTRSAPATSAGGAGYGVCNGPTRRRSSGSVSTRTPSSSRSTVA